MDGKMLARLGAVVFVAAAVTATVIELTRKEERPEAAVFSRHRGGDTDPMRAALRRCRNMGEAAINDPACLKAWAEHRDQFLDQRTAPTQPITPPTPAAGPSATNAMVEDPIAKETAPVEDVAPVMQPEPARSGAH